VGLAQRFNGVLQDVWDSKKLSGEKPHEAMTIKREYLWKNVEIEFQVAQKTAPVLGQPALMTRPEPYGCCHAHCEGGMPVSV
jgi:hypothetical protein